MSDRAEPDTSQSSAAAGVVAATPQMSTTASDSPTTPEQQPVSKQASTSKRSGYVSLRLRRVRHSSSVPVDAPTPSPDPQAAREEYQAVSSVLPPPTAVRVRRPAPVQVSIPPLWSTFSDVTHPLSTLRLRPSLFPRFPSEHQPQICRHLP